MQLRYLPLIAALVVPAIAHADNIPAAHTLPVTLGGIEDGKRIPDNFAYCVPNGKGQTKDGGNTSPAISWSQPPAGTQSYAVIVLDKDVPASFESANQQGKTIATDFARQDFYHWVLVDVPATITGLPEGKDSSGITPGGKSPGKTAYGIDGQNDYPKAGKGKGGGYDGACPPWNDERLHHYHFMVYALDVPSLGLSGNFTGAQAEKAMASHILAKGEVVGTYSNNAKLLAQ
jgi:Raf kinase inhibitor-like YbhB/YbcL family protein